MRIADVLDGISGAHLVDVHADNPDDEWRAVYIWNGSLTVNVYGLTGGSGETAAECIDCFTFATQPSRSEVLASIAAHWREATGYADTVLELTSEVGASTAGRGAQ